MFRRQCTLLAKKCSIGMVSNLKPGKHLSYGHPSMERVRQWVQYQVESKRVSPLLCCNFDQVWSMNWRPRRRVLQHKGGPDGVDPLMRQKSLRKVRHAFERLMGASATEQMNKKSAIKEASVTGGVAANVPVESFRLPHTLTTLS